MIVRLFPLLLASLSLAACGGGGNATAGGVTPAEAEALNQAAEQLDRQTPPPRIEQSAPQPQK